MPDLLDETILHLRERAALGMDASLTHEQTKALAGIATRDELEHTVIAPYPGNAAPPKTKFGQALADALGWAWGPAQGVPSSAEVCDGLAAELEAAGFGDLFAAWNAGWHALVDQERQQQADPTHPITRKNPHDRRRA